MQNTIVNAPHRVSFSNKYVKCTMDIAKDWSTVALSGTVSLPSDYATIEIIAANAADRMTNYSGSGLPFTCANMAFDGTPNYLQVNPTSVGEFKGVFSYPNSFYSQDGFDKITPSIFVRLYLRDPVAEPIFVRMELPELTPLQVRSLTHRENRSRLGPEFYSAKADIIGIQSAYDTMVALKDLKIYRGLA